MKRYFLLLLLLSPLLLADDAVKKVQRLEKVTWNPVTHELSWQISEGHTDVHGQYEPERLVGSFFIEPQAATMSFAGKKQGFTHQEGDHLHDILDSLSHYLMSSTLWWQEVKREPKKFGTLTQFKGSKQSPEEFTLLPSPAGPQGSKAR